MHVFVEDEERCIINLGRGWIPSIPVKPSRSCICGGTHQWLFPPYDGNDNLSSRIRLHIPSTHDLFSHLSLLSDARQIHLRYHTPNKQQLPLPPHNSTSTTARNSCHLLETKMKTHVTRSAKLLLALCWMTACIAQNVTSDKVSSQNDRKPSLNMHILTHHFSLAQTRVPTGLRRQQSCLSRLPERY